MGKHKRLVHKHKEQVLAKGYSQKNRIDYNETFTLIVRLDTIRTLLTLIAQKK